MTAAGADAPADLDRERGDRMIAAFFFFGRCKR